MNSLTSSSISESISQFQNLSKRVSKTTVKPRVKKYESKPTMMSPREEIYKSMIREINNESAQMNSLVHKASGILRLTHHKDIINKNRKVTVSWDIDGRRVLTYEDKAGTEKSLLQRQTDFDRRGKKNLLASLSEPIFGLDSHNLKALSEYVHTNNKSDNTNDINGAADGELPRKKVSKIWEEYIDSGDASKLWQSKEGILSTESQSQLLTDSPLSEKTSLHQMNSRTSQPSISKSKERPPWKTVYKAPTSEYVFSSTSHPPSISSLPSSMASKRTVSQHKNNSVSRRSSRTQSSFILREKDNMEKVERIQHICVVNGSVVAFKNFGFENFTNWFGDESMLEANQQRCQPKIHYEMDFTNVKTRDIKIRLLDGCKLEVVSRRCIPGTSKSIRLKDSVLIPKEFRVEDLLVCRTKAGKLVVEDITPQPVVFKSEHSKLKSSKSKARWQISRK